MTDHTKSIDTQKDSDVLSSDEQPRTRSFFDGVVLAPPRRKRVVSNKPGDVARARE